MKLRTKITFEFVIVIIIFLATIILGKTALPYLAGITAISLALVFYFSYRITNPLNKITQDLKEISLGKLDVEVDPKLLKSKDEIGELANAFDRVLISLKLAVEKGVTKEELKFEEEKPEEKFLKAFESIRKQKEDKNG